MSWRVSYLPEAEEDLMKLDNSQRILIRKAIAKVSERPVSVNEGGYGKPLGKKSGTNLTNFFKIKLKASGLRIVYQLIQVEGEMRIIVIGMRADDQVYEEAQMRLKRR